MIRKGIVIGVFSAKGGVGKTTIVVNVGAALAQKLKKRVVVVETNMTSSNLGLYLGILDPPVVVQDVVLGRAPIWDAIVPLENGLHLIPGSVSFTGEIGSVDLRSLLDPLRKKYSVIVLDSAPGFGTEVISGLRASDELLIVCQPQVPAIAGTLQTFRAADRLKVPIAGVVLNRVTGKRYEVPISDIRRTLGWPTIAVVPEDDSVPESTTKGAPVVLEHPNSPAGVEFTKLAGKILARIKARRAIRVRRARISKAKVGGRGKTHRKRK